MKDNETRRSPSMEALSDESLDNVTGGAVVVASAAAAAAAGAADAADTAEAAVGSLNLLTDSAKKRIWVPSVNTSDGSDDSPKF